MNSGSPLSRSRLALAVGLAAAVWTAASCVSVERDEEPAPDASADGHGADGDGHGADGAPVEPAVELGFRVDGEFHPVEDGGTWFVVHGFQGGLWTMPTIRARGFLDKADLDLRLVADDGEILGALSLRQRLSPAGGGWWQIRDLPVSVDLPVSDLPELAGRGAVVTCTLADDVGTVITRELDVVLDEGVLP